MSCYVRILKLFKFEMTMKSKFGPNAELGDFLVLLQETIEVCGVRLTDRAVCRCTGMSSKTYVNLKRASIQTSICTMP